MFGATARRPTGGRLAGAPHRSSAARCRASATDRSRPAPAGTPRWSTSPTGNADRGDGGWRSVGCALSGQMLDARVVQRPQGRGAVSMCGSAAWARPAATGPQSPTAITCHGPRGAPLPMRPTPRRTPPEPVPPTRKIRCATPTNRQSTTSSWLVRDDIAAGRSSLSRAVDVVSTWSAYWVGVGAVGAAGDGDGRRAPFEGDPERFDDVPRRAGVRDRQGHVPRAQLHRVGDGEVRVARGVGYETYAQHLLGEILGDQVGGADAVHVGAAGGGQCGDGRAWTVSSPAAVSARVCCSS
ncbi:hypothetical protein STENM327S_08415 [Streptomyces tendae]